MGVTFSHKGSFSNTEKFLNFLLRKDWINLLDKYGRLGVEALRSSTPVDTGLASNSWNYVIERDDKYIRLVWTNDDIEGGLNVAVLIDRGHATKNGGWVPGYHFIDETLDPIINQLVREVGIE